MKSYALVVPVTYGYVKVLFMSVRNLQVVEQLIVTIR